MKLDKFTIFACFNIEQQDMLKPYITENKYERSSFKGIPISLYDQFTKMLPSKNRRIRFRGRSRQGYLRPRDFVHKEFAETFAIYYDEVRIWLI